MQIEHQRRVLKPLRRTRAFTLIEVMVVISIFAVLSAVAWMAISGRVKAAAKLTTLKSDMRQVITAINLYRTDNDEGLPQNWKSFGYYGVNKKDKFGPGYPPTDVRYDAPPTYDTSYHTPECAAPPKASPVFFLFQQNITKFTSRPRANQLDPDRDQALRFEPACQPNSSGKHDVKYLRDGVLETRELAHIKSMSSTLSGTLSYQWLPDWIHEINLGN